MASVNSACLIGNLGADPEVRRMQNGNAVVNLRLATSESWKDKNTGERKEKTEWHKVVIFNEGLAKVAENYLKKGSKIYIEGKIQTKKYTDKDNIERYSTEIVLENYGGRLVMLSGGGGGEAAAGGGDAAKPATTGVDDEVPF